MIRSALFLFSVLVSLAFAPAAAQEEPDTRLVVVVAVDQMIPEQLDRLAPYFSGGLARFVRKGLVFPEAKLGHGLTETGPGHATLATGLHPNRHGVVSNGWMGPEGQDVYCLEDTVAFVDDRGRQPAGDDGRSPRNLRAPTLGDLLLELSPESRTVSIAGKDRAAIAMGGQRPAMCLWWNKRTGGFMSSEWYLPELPWWVLDWNSSWRSVLGEAGLENGWTISLPEEVALVGTVVGDRPGEASRSRIDRMLGEAGDDSPRALASVAGYAYRTPGVDHAVFAAARLAVEALELGADDAPDALMLGLSACDIVGHSHGPYSDEVTDVLLRIDYELGRLFGLLDERVGADHWVATLTADHGVLPLPGEARRRGFPAQVIPGLLVQGTIGEVRERLREEYDDDYVVAANGDGIRFSSARIASAGLAVADVRRTAAEAARESSGWLERVYTHEELAAGSEDEDPWLRALSLSFDAERSPDVMFVRRPWSLLGMMTGTSHGSPYVYDRRIALAFVGAGVPTGRRYDEAGSVDVVPTLLGWLGVDAPAGLDGRVLFSR